MRLRDKINADLTAAMKAKDNLRLSVLRMVKTAIRNKEIDLRTELEDGPAFQVLSTLIKQRKDSIEQFTGGGRIDLAEKEAAEIKIIEEYLPAGVSVEEIEKTVDDVVRETGASSARDLGTVMKHCMARFAGKVVDGKLVNAAVRRRLEPKV
ncbi:MAG: GatB/YqeY domain-containing protein [Acidobacteriota bacterium]